MNKDIKKEKLRPELRFKEFKEEWKIDKLQDISKFSKGKNISKVDIDSNGKYPCIRYGELYTHYKEYAKDIISRTNLDKDKLVFSKSNDVIIPASGETAIDISTAVYIDKDDIALGGDLNIIRSPLYGHFLALSLSNKKKKAIARLAQGISVIHLYPEHLKTVEISYPTLPEQQKISSFLSLIDKKIELLNKKKELLEIYKKGIMHNIFNRDIRFKDSNGNDYPEWEEKRLGDLLKEYRKKTKLENEYIVLTSSNKGLIPQSEYYKESLSEEKSNIGFNILPVGYITYRSRSDNRKFTFNQNNTSLPGIISKYYPVFSIAKGNGPFITNLLNYKKHFVGRYSEGTSQTVLSFNTLAGIPISIPQEEEQTQIAKFLPQLDKSITIVAQQILKIHQFKNSLLQKMFI